MKPKIAVDRIEPKRRDNTLPNELRELEKLIHAFAGEFSFARAEMEQLKKKTASAIAAWHVAEARHRQEHHQTRARLNTLFPRIERWIYASDDEEMKTFFRRVWRDAPNTPPKHQADKEPQNSGGPSAAVARPSAQTPSPAESSSTSALPKRG